MGFQTALDLRLIRPVGRLVVAAFLRRVLLIHPATREVI
jgi:hypothetical protein